jgi:hypothetical protein
MMCIISALFTVIDYKGLLRALKVLYTYVGLHAYGNVVCV